MFNVIQSGKGRRGARTFNPMIEFPGPAAWLIANLKYLTKYRKAIEYNKRTGNHEEEQKQILKTSAISEYSRVRAGYSFFCRTT